jgi:hypothetical protein
MWSGDEEPPETAVERVLVDGRARFEGLEPGSYGARASLADHVDLHAYVVIPEAKGTMLTLRSGTAVVEGTAWDEEGRPTPGLKIVLSHKASNTTTYTWTGEDGRYALDRLEPGAHWVSMNGRDVIRSSTTILPGLNRLDFGSPEPCPHWSGTLRTRSGSAHRGRMVLWIRRTPQDLTTRVVEDGRFDLRLLPGTYRVIGKPDAFSSFEVDLGEIVVPPGDFERDLVLPGARVSGVLRRSDGAPLSESSRLTVGLRAPDGKVGLRSVLADEASRFTIDAVEPGVYLLSTHPLVVDGGGESLRLELLSGQDELVLDVFVRAP